MKKLFPIIILLVLIPAIGFGQEGYIHSPGGAGSVSDTAYDATSWDGVTDVAPSKNAVRDKIEAPTPPTVQSVTCTSEGTGAHGALTITPTAALNRVYINLTVEDVHGCTITMAETGAVAGTIAHITNISAYHADFADQANILKLFGSPFSMGQNETTTLLYTNSQWDEIARATATWTGLTFNMGGTTGGIKADVNGNLVYIAEVDGSAHVHLTADQVTGTVIYNTGQAGADVDLLLPAAAAGYNFLATVGTAQAFHWGVTSNTGDDIYLVAAAGTTSQCGDQTSVVMTAAQVGQAFACWTFRSGSPAYDWMCKAISIGTSTFACHTAISGP